MHTTDTPGLQQSSKRHRKCPLLLIALALLLASILTLLSSTPAQAIGQRANQQAQLHQLAACPNGPTDPNTGNCVTLPSGPPNYTPGNKQIQNPLANQSPLLFFTSLDYTVN